MPCSSVGGGPVVVDDVSKLPAAFKRIATGLSTKYSLAYMSADARRDQRFRSIEVRVADKTG